jgi:hypothetical protein
VGVIKVEAVGDPEGETLMLVERRELKGDELRDARQNARRLDRRGYKFVDVYKHTPPVVPLGDATGT